MKMEIGIGLEGLLEALVGNNDEDLKDTPLCLVSHFPTLKPLVDVYFSTQDELNTKIEALAKEKKEFMKSQWKLMEHELISLELITKEEQPTILLRIKDGVVFRRDKIKKD